MAETQHAAATRYQRPTVELTTPAQAVTLRDSRGLQMTQCVTLVAGWSRLFVDDPRERIMQRN